MYSASLGDSWKDIIRKDAFDRPCSKRAKGEWDEEEEADCADSNVFHTTLTAGREVQSHHGIPCSDLGTLSQLDKHKASHLYAPCPGARGPHCSVSWRDEMEEAYGVDVRRWQSINLRWYNLILHL